MGVNPVRGEVEVVVGDVTLVMAATMDGLARLSGALGNPTFAELAQRLVGTEMVATRSAIRLFTVRGTGSGGEAMTGEDAAAAAVDGFLIDDLSALQAGFSSLLETLTRKGKASPEKNG